MKLSIIVVTVIVTLLTVFERTNAGAVDQLFKKVKNNLSTYFVKKQIKQIGTKIGQNCIAQKSLESSQQELQNFIMNKVITQKQIQDLTILLNKMSTELGGMDKTTNLVSILIQEIAQQLQPYEKEILAKCKKMKKNKQKNKKIVNTSMKMMANMIKPAVVQKAIDNIKKRFSQKQCDCAFKYMAPKYVKLGLYKFKATKCTGNGN